MMGGGEGEGEREGGVIEKGQREIWGVRWRES